MWEAEGNRKKNPEILESWQCFVNDESEQIKTVKSRQILTYLYLERVVACGGRWKAINILASN
jgi:hypothetical protein